MVTTVAAAAPSARAAAGSAAALGPLPGDACGAAAAGAQHTWVALAWDKTCECTDPKMAPQSNGSFCVWWNLTAPCAQYPTCGAKPGDVTCKKFDNVWEMPRWDHRHAKSVRSVSFLCSR